MTFVAKQWTDSAETLIDAAAMIDVEQRLADYVDTKFPTLFELGAQYASFHAATEEVLPTPGDPWLSAAEPDVISFTLTKGRVVRFAMQLNAWHPGSGVDVHAGLFVDGAIALNELGTQVERPFGAGVEAPVIMKSGDPLEGTRPVGGGGGSTNKAPFPDHAFGFTAWLEAGAHSAEIKYFSEGGTQARISQRHLVVAM